MSRSMIGHKDRTVPAGAYEPIRVRTLVNRVYRETGTETEIAAISEQQRDVFEKEAFSDAISRLEPADEKYIREKIKNADPNQKLGQSIKIKNFGTIAALELIAKLGIWLDGNIPEGQSVRRLAR